MLQIPDNPEKVPDAIRDRDDLSFEDMVVVLDALRRNLEFTEGSPKQEDASASGKVTVPGNSSLTVRITPEEDKNQYLSEVGVQPDDGTTDFTLKADDISTDSNNLYFDNPFTVRREIQITLDNLSATQTVYDYFTTARAVKQRGGRR